MSKNEKARSTAATVKRAEAAAFSGAAASFYQDFTTPTNARQVSDILPHGAANAIEGAALAAVLGFKDRRALSKQIERERRSGHPICAAVAGKSRGYYLANDPDELQRYIKALDRRIREVRRTRDACNETLCRLSGQTVLEGWNG